MNLPNKLTMLRVIMIPFFVLVLLVDKIPYHNYIAVAIFILASLTDLLDGKIARARNLVTNFGKFMDPLADKLLVCSAFICFIELSKVPTWMVLIIIAREFVISGFRLVAADNGVVIAASMWGKYKTAFSMVTICFLTIDIANPIFYMITQVLLWISLILTVVSLVDYIVKNKGVFEGSM